ncbi:MAG: type II toxin-antitoxin system VapC family toxin [Blastocatellales bacterium]
MIYFADTNILLRFLNRADPNYTATRAAVRILKSRGDGVVTAAQNLAEFWNTLTRPASARSGYGLSTVDAEFRLRYIERHFSLLPDSPLAYAEWRRLVTTSGVSGVQVHDARIAALMKTYQVTHIITLNKRDFLRYSGIIPLRPQEI